MQCICNMKRWQNCEFLSIFLTKEGLNKYIKLLCKTLYKTRRQVFCKKGVVKIDRNSQFCHLIIL